MAWRQAWRQWRDSGIKISSAKSSGGWHQREHQWRAKQLSKYQWRQMASTMAISGGKRHQRRSISGVWRHQRRKPKRGVAHGVMALCGEKSGQQ